HLLGTLLRHTPQAHLLGTLLRHTPQAHPSGTPKKEIAQRCYAQGEALQEGTPALADALILHAVSEFPDDF
ncbi:hypothetical protein COY28_06165, partial [Candidatus Woesearchaeota archaeon CG_4_10_14_0_2_um_filter_57_5]